jgi:ribonuclease T2
LEQIFIPQYCRDLLVGVDSTISHSKVLPYPDGVRCDPDAAEKSQLTIHGLWPNYNAGYAGCCNVSETTSNHPYHALEFAVEHLLLLTEMKYRWIDPTQNNTYFSLCEIYNHEYQKHGVCYGAVGNNWALGAAIYFRATLNAASRHFLATRQINRWADNNKQQQTTLAEITALYPKKVQVLCSAVDKYANGSYTNQLSAIRTCYDKPEEYGSIGPFKHRDCADATKSAAFIPCDGTVPITLLPYTGPK